MIILRPKNVIFERFWPLSKFHFSAYSTLFIQYSEILQILQYKGYIDKTETDATFMIQNTLYRSDK